MRGGSNFAAEMKNLGAAQEKLRVGITWFGEYRPGLSAVAHTYMNIMSG